MSELFIKTTPFISEVWENAKQYHPSQEKFYDFIYGPEIPRIASRFNQTMIGWGLERFVIPFSETQVLAVPYYPADMTPEKAWQEHMINVIASAAFPHNIPEISHVFPFQDYNYVPGSLRRWIRGEPMHDEECEFGKIGLDRLWTDIKKRSKGIRHPFQKVADVLDRYAVPFMYDNIGFNFILTNAGEEYYVDELTLVSPDEIPWDIKGFMRYIIKNNPNSSPNLLLPIMHELNENSQALGWKK